MQIAGGEHIFSYVVSRHQKGLLEVTAMGMPQNILSLVLTVLLSLGFFSGGEAVEEKQGPPVPSTAVELRLDIEQCNVRLEIIDGDTMAFAYDEANIQIDSKTEGAVTTITVTGVSPAAQNGSQIEMTVIQIPEDVYQTVTVNADQAGVSIPGIQADVDVTGEESAVSISIPEGAENTYHVRLVNSSGSADVTHMDHAVLTLNTQQSAVSVPDSWPILQPGAALYTYTKGNGQVSVTIELEGCAFAIVD